jgi:hypothetical protein
MPFTAYANTSLVAVYDGDSRIAYSIPQGDELKAPADWPEDYHGVNTDEADARLEDELGFVAGEWVWDEERQLHVCTDVDRLADFEAALAARRPAAGSADNPGD